MKKFEIILGMILAFLVANLAINIAILQNLKEMAHKPVETAVQSEGADYVEISKAIPQLVKRVEPQYPEEAIKRGWEGKVFLRALVDTNGNVADIEVIRSSGYSCLDSAAVEAAKKFEFKPVVENGVKKASYVVIPFCFSLQER